VRETGSNGKAARNLVLEAILFKYAFPQPSRKLVNHISSAGSSFLEGDPALFEQYCD
jgi:hypothetical protein